MKIIATVVFILIAQLIYGQEFKYPIFSATVKNINACIPSGWVLRDSVTGDLNGDAIRDFAIVIESKDTLDEMRPDSFTNYGSPRILLIGFYDKGAGKYNLVLQNNTFITRYNEGGMAGDAYDGMTISNKVLTMKVEFVRGSVTYKFRYQNNDFYLIGANSSGVSGGQFDGWDINFSTKKALHSWGAVSDEKSKEKWEKVSHSTLKKLRDMKMILEFEVFPNVYL